MRLKGRGLGTTIGTLQTTWMNCGGGEGSVRAEEHDSDGDDGPDFSAISETNTVGL